MFWQPLELFKFS